MSNLLSTPNLRWGATLMISDTAQPSGSTVKLCSANVDKILQDSVEIGIGNFIDERGGLSTATLLRPLPQ